jgi:hypothetical protein
LLSQTVSAARSEDDRVYEAFSFPSNPHGLSLDYTLAQLAKDNLTLYETQAPVAPALEGRIPVV